MGWNHKHLHDHCFKILPLVYDESLSYYELLCKVMKTVNEISEAVEDITDDMSDIVGRIIEEWLEQNLGIPFYNVTYYDIEPDSGDVYTKLHALMKEKVSQTGGIVYFPPGLYTISYTVWIPQNTTVCGAGELSEIYFNEQDTYLGIGLCNAGSNVTIRDIKLSQASKTNFVAGAQAGCAGYSSNAYENVFNTPYQHRVIKADARNLCVKNVVFDGKYAFQTECEASYKIENLVYENLYAPSSCVSMESFGLYLTGASLSNIVCDLFRITGQTAFGAGGLRGVSVKNVDCNRAYINAYVSMNDAPINIEGMYVNSERTINHEYFRATTTCYFSGNMNFKGCVFNGRAAQTEGIGVANGAVSFEHCIFNFVDTIITQRRLTSDPDMKKYYQVYNDCVFKNGENATRTRLSGYGRNNDISQAHNMLMAIWGDSAAKIASTGATNASGSFSSYAKAANNAIHLVIYGVVQGEGILFTANDRLAGLPISDGAVMSGIAFVNTDRTAAIPIMANYDATNKTFVVNSILNSLTDQNRFYVDTLVALDRTPNPEELYDLYS